MTAKYNFTQAYMEDGDTYEESYVYTHSDGVYLNNEETKTLSDYIEDRKFENARGTATAITLNVGELVTGYSKTFIAKANNNGSATTINGKPLYKPATTTAPTLKANKAYTVWFNEDSDCFFFKASAEGNATAENVLADKTFSNDDDTSIVGTMPNNGRLETTLITHGATYNIPSGYTSGGQVKTNITNCTAENIKYNVPVGGVTGSFTGDGTIDASKVVKDYIGYSKGSRIVGTATIESLGGYKYVSGTVDVPLFYSKRGPSDSYIWSNETITLKEALNNKYKNIICYSISYIGCEDYNAGQSSRKMRDISAYGIIFKDMKKGMMCPRASMSLTQYNEINFDTETREIFDDFTIMSIGNGCPIAKYWNNPADGATVTYGTIKYGIICNDA